MSETRACCVTVMITNSAGQDGAPVVFVDTDPELDGPNGPAIRILLNDEPVFVGKDYVPPAAADERTEQSSGNFGGSNPEQSDCGAQATSMPAGDEFNVFIPGRDRCDDWTSLDEALDQAVAFFGLSCFAVTIEARCRS